MTRQTFLEIVCQTSANTRLKNSQEIVFSKAQDPLEKCFITGAYNQGGITGVRRRCREFPACTRLLVALARLAFPGLNFTSVGLFRNMQTALHKDANNLPGSRNGICALSFFEGGQLRLHRPDGPVDLSLSEGPLQFDPFLEHETLPWSNGFRIVLVAFSVNRLERLTPEHRAMLTAFDIPLPLSKEQLEPASQFSQDQSKPISQCPQDDGEAGMFLELFAGTARLSQAFTRLGFQALAFDKVCKSSHPVQALDFADRSECEVVLQLIQDHASSLQYVHMAPPQETCLAARNKEEDQPICKVCGFMSDSTFDDLCEVLWIGIPRTPSDFVQQAVLAGHPKRILEAQIDERTKLLVDNLLNGRAAHEDLGKSRLAEWSKIAKELEPVEEQARKSLDPLVSKILGGKRTFLLERLLADSSFPDQSLVPDLRKGFPLTGWMPRNAATLARVSSQAVDAVAEKAWSETLEEQQKGWLFEDPDPDLSSILLVSGKTIDLKWAYKQYAVDPSDREIFRIIVLDTCSRKPKFFGAAALPFGTTGSVAGFLRTSAATWHIGSALLGLSWCNYFDDFPLFSLDEHCPCAESCAEALLDILGITFAREGKKATEFSKQCRALGLIIDLSEFGQGVVYIKHTPERIQELRQTLTHILESGLLESSEAEALRGRLHWFSSFLFGRRPCQALRVLGLRAKGLDRGKKLSSDLRDALTYLRDRALESPPVQLTPDIKETFYVFTDGSLEGDVAGVGGILYDPLGKPLSFFAASLPIDALNRLKETSSHPIYEVELLAIWAALKLWMSRLTRCLVVIYLDNEAAKGALVSGKSSTLPGQSIVSSVLDLEDSARIRPWYGRVPTSSNPADAALYGLPVITLLSAKTRSCVAGCRKRRRDHLLIVLQPLQQPFRGLGQDVVLGQQRGDALLHGCVVAFGKLICYPWFHPIFPFLRFLFLAGGCSSICPLGPWNFAVRPQFGAAPEFPWSGIGAEVFQVWEESAGRQVLTSWVLEREASVFFSVCARASGEMSGEVPAQQAQQPQAAHGAPQGQPALSPEMQQQVDAVVRQRVQQAFGNAFGQVLQATEKMAKAAESQASIVRNDGLAKMMKMDVWRPANREEELRTWKDWQFQLVTWLTAHDSKYAGDLDDIEDDVVEDHALMAADKVQRSQRLFGVLVSLLKGRPLLLVKGFEKERAGFEAMRVLRREMEPKERARSLALLRQLASWTFKEGNVHEQLVQFEDAVASYESSSGKSYPPDLQIATVVANLREPLRSQVQLRMTSTTEYSNLREWILQYESVNAPWASTLPMKGGSPGFGGGGGGAQPMEVDVVKGKDGKGKKGKDGKGDKGKKGQQPSWKGQQQPWKGQQQQPWKGQQQQPWKGQQQQPWKGQQQQPSWKGQQQQPWKSNTWDKQAAKGKGKQQCHNCGQYGHWKWECPTKGKGKVNQVDAAATAVPSSSQSTASGATQPSTATALQRSMNYNVNRIEVNDAPPFFEDTTHLFDISAMGVFQMDATDHDGNWTLETNEPNANCDLYAQVPGNVLAVQAQPVQVEVVVDSGADVSVAPLRFAGCGSEGPPSEITMHDAQGRLIPERGTRLLDVKVEDTAGNMVTIRERFSIARVSSLILSLGRLLRWGWQLGHESGMPVISREGTRIPIRLRRNTLTVMGFVSLISLAGQVPAASGCVNALGVSDDMGRLPAAAEGLAHQAGWHILGSGLPFLVVHKAKRVSLEESLWNTGDWPWMALFVRQEPAERLPKAGDLWTQMYAMETTEFDNSPKELEELNADLKSAYDYAILLHVEQLPTDLLTNPRDFFEEPPNDYGGGVVLPADESGGGVGDDGMQGGVGIGRDMEEEVPDGEVLEGVALSVETPLKELRELCSRQGLPTSGGKNKILKRLKQHHEILEHKLASELAHKLFLEEARPPDVPRAPRLPSARQQELHNVTHQPFAAWCPACVAGRAKASPHKPREEAKDGPDLEKGAMPVIQIDYGYTFTRRRNQETDEGDCEAEPGPEDVDLQDQYGLTLFGVESTTGWQLAIPVLQKGAGALRRVTEQLVRASMQISPAGPVMFQGDPEASIKQIINSVVACRSRLGLHTQTRLIPRGSHESNGMVERTIQTVRANSRTLRAHLEERAKIKVEGHTHVFPWLMRHAAFLLNRFSVPVRGNPPFELVYGKCFHGSLIPFGEQCLYHAPTRHRGDLQWLRGIYVGQSERNGASILLSEAGAVEARSIRRLPAEEQWDGPAILACRGLPWDYMGTAKRKRPLYTSAARPPLLPDTASLEELAEVIAAATPRPGNDEAGSDSPERPSTLKEDQGRQPPRAQSQLQRWTQEKPEEAVHAKLPRKLSQCLRGPGFYSTGVRHVHGDIPLEEWSNHEDWIDEVGEALEADVGDDVWDVDPPPEWDPEAEKAPELSEEDLAKVDRASDLAEVTRLQKMGVLREPKPGEKIESYTRLTTKLVRDWRRRPGWTRRSRLVAREFRGNSPYTAELFAPASTLGTTHAFLIWAISHNLEVVSLDIKDAYLQVDQPNPAVIMVDSGILNDGREGLIPFILEKLLPGQRIGASAWYDFAKSMLEECNMESFDKEPTLFRHINHDNRTGLILHADDGLLASTATERERILGKVGSQVTVQTSLPLKDPGSELEFLKRRYVMTEEGIVVYPKEKYAEALFAGIGKSAKLRDAPSGATFLEPDSSKDLDGNQAREYREAVGRLLYLSHSRADIQFPVCVLSSKMAAPTAMAMKWLQRVIGYLKKFPTLGILLRPARDGGCFGFNGRGGLQYGELVIESITDADWAGCKRTRRSRTSIQLFVGGSMVASYVRSQRSIALSSGESEFIAMVGGSGEALYVAECVRFLAEGANVEVTVKARTDSAACRGIAQRVGCGRIRHIDTGLLWIQQAVKAKKLSVGVVPGYCNTADLGTKPLQGPRIRELLHLMSAKDANLEEFGKEDYDQACARRGLATALKAYKSETGGARVSRVKKVMPLLILMCQVMEAEGLSFGAPLFDEELLASILVALVVGLLVLGVPWVLVTGFFRLSGWLAGWCRQAHTATDQETQAKITTREVGVQADRGISRSEERFQEEYVQRATELRQALAERCMEVRNFQDEVMRLRDERRLLERELVQARGRAVPPERIAVTTARGERYHLPTCGLAAGAAFICIRPSRFVLSANIVLSWRACFIVPSIAEYAMYQPERVSPASARPFLPVHDTIAAIALVAQARGDDLSQSAPYQRLVAWAASRASGAESLSVMLRVLAVLAEGHYFPAAVQEGLLTLSLGQQGASSLERDIHALRQPGALPNPMPLHSAPPELPAHPMHAEAPVPQATPATSTPSAGTPRPRVALTGEQGAQAADDCIDAAPLPTDDNAPAGASQGGAGHSALAGIPALAWSSLDAVDLAAEFGTPVPTMQSVPAFLRAGVRQAFVFALRALREAYTRGAALQQTRAWKLFLLSPRLLLHRAREPGTVGREALLQRTRDFLAGRWEAACARRRELACANVRADECDRAEPPLADMVADAHMHGLLQPGNRQALTVASQCAVWRLGTVLILPDLENALSTFAPPGWCIHLEGLIETGDVSSIIEGRPVYASFVPLPNERAATADEDQDESDATSDISMSIADAAPVTVELSPRTSAELTTATDNPPQDRSRSPRGRVRDGGTFSAGFIVLAQEYAPELVRLGLEAGLEVAEVLKRVQDGRVPQARARFPLFPLLVAAEPQTLGHLGVLLAYPEWTNDVSIVFDCTLVHGGVFSWIVSTVLDRESILAIAGVSPPELYEVYVHNSDTPLLPRQECFLRQGSCVTIAPGASHAYVSSSLPSMLESPDGWEVVDTLPTAPGEWAYVIADAGPFSLSHQAGRRRFLQTAVAPELQLLPDSFAIQLACPDILDYYDAGRRIHTVLATTQMHLVDADRSETGCIYFLDFRPIYCGLTWAFSADRVVSKDLIRERSARALPAGFHPIVRGGRTLSDPAGSIEVHPGEVLVVEVVQHAGLPASDENDDPDVGDKPVSSEGSALDHDDALSCQPSADAHQPSAAAAEPNSASPSHEPAGQRSSISTTAHPRQRMGHLLSACTDRGIMCLTVSTQHALPESKLWSTSVFSVGRQFQNRCKKSAASPPPAPLRRRCKLLQEPASASFAAERSLAAARTATRVLGQRWPFDPAWMPVLPIQEEDDPEDLDEALPGDTVVDAIFCIFTPGYIPEVLPLHLMIPQHVPDVIDLLSTCRNSEQAHAFPTLVAIWPQPQPSWGAFVAKPTWLHHRAVVCFDMARWDGRIFAIDTPAIVDKFHLLQCAGLHLNAEVDIFLPDAIDPVPAGGDFQLRTGMCRVFLPPGRMPPPTFEMWELLQTPQHWQLRPQLPFVQPDEYYLVVTEQGNHAFRLLPERSVYLRTDLAVRFGFAMLNMCIQPAQPRRQDASICGHGCRNVVVLSPQSLQANTEAEIMCLIDGRALLIGWLPLRTEGGHVSITFIRMSLQHCVPEGWEAEFRDVPRHWTWWLEPGQTLVVTLTRRENTPPDIHRDGRPHNPQQEPRGPDGSPPQSRPSAMPAPSSGNGDSPRHRARSDAGRDHASANDGRVVCIDGCRKSLCAFLVAISILNALCGSTCGGWAEEETHFSRPFHGAAALFLAIGVSQRRTSLLVLLLVFALGTHSGAVAVHVAVPDATNDLGQECLPCNLPYRSRPLPTPCRAMLTLSGSSAPEPNRPRIDIEAAAHSTARVAHGGPMPAEEDGVSITDVGPTLLEISIREDDTVLWETSTLLETLLEHFQETCTVRPAAATAPSPALDSCPRTICLATAVAPPCYDLTEQSVQLPHKDCLVVSVLTCWPCTWYVESHAALSMPAVTSQYVQDWPAWTQLSCARNNASPTRLQLFTDGSWSPDRSVGGFAVVIVACVGEQSCIFGAVSGQTHGAADNPWPLADAPPALRNEEIAVAVALLWLLQGVTLFSFDEVEVWFDCFAAGKTASGEWTASTPFGKQLRDLQLWAESLLLGKMRYCHVKAHQGHPLNEMADHIAKLAADGARPTVSPPICAIESFLKLDASWISAALRNNGSSALPFSATGNSMCWASNIAFKPCKLEPIDIVPINETMIGDATDHVVDLAVRAATVNIQGLQDKAPYLEAQFAEQGLQIIFLQETKAPSGVCQSKLYMRLSTEPKRHFGVSIWISKSFGIATHNGKPLPVSEHDLRIHFETERLLVVVATVADLQITLFSGHCPHSGQRAEAAKFVSCLKNVLCPLRRSSALIGGIDLNGRPPRDVTGVTGGLECGEADATGIEFAQVLQDLHAWLPSTYQRLHTGPSEVCSEVLRQVDLGAARDDHFLTSCALRGVLDHHGHLRRLWRPRFDVDKMLSPEGRDIIAREASQFQSPNWDVHPDEHCRLLTKHLQQIMQRHFQFATHRPRASFIPAAVWACRDAKLNLKYRSRHRAKLWSDLVVRAFWQWKTAEDHSVCEVVAHEGLFYQLNAAAVRFASYRIRGDIRSAKTAFLQNLVLKGGDTATDILSTAKKAGIGGAKRRKPFKPMPHLLDSRGNLVGTRADRDQVWLEHFGQQEYGRVVPVEQFLRLSPEPLVIDSELEWHSQHLPSLRDVEEVLRGLPRHKAAGLDAVPAELLRASPGGLLFEAWKQSGTQREAASYRSLYVASVVGKAYHKLQRRTIQPEVEATLHEFHMGARKGTPVVMPALYVLASQRAGEVFGHSSAVLFLDTHAAYYRIVRDLALGCIYDDAVVVRLFEHFSLDATELQEMMQVVCQGGTFADNRVPDTIRHAAKDTHHFTWFVTPHTSGRFLCKTEAGSRPGESWADTIFSFVYSRVLARIAEIARAENLLPEFLFDVETGPFAAPGEGESITGQDATWADDSAWPLLAPVPEQLLAKATRLASLVLEQCAAHGMKPNLGRNKTALMYVLRGKGVVRATRQYFSHGNATLRLPELDRDLPVTNQYKHLGGLIDHRLKLSAEARRRLAMASQAFDQGKELLYLNPAIPLSTRAALMQIAVTSTYHNLPIWNPAGPSWAMLDGGYTRLVRRLLSKALPGDLLFRLPAALAHVVTGCMPLPLLAKKARLSLLCSMCTAGPKALWAALQSEQTWFATIRADLKWLADTVRQEWPLLVGAAWPQWRELMANRTAWFKRQVRTGLQQEMEYFVKRQAVYAALWALQKHAGALHAPPDFSEVGNDWDEVQKAAHLDLCETLLDPSLPSDPDLIILRLRTALGRHPLFEDEAKDLLEFVMHETREVRGQLIDEEWTHDTVEAVEAAFSKLLTNVWGSAVDRTAEPSAPTSFKDLEQELSNIDWAALRPSGPPLHVTPSDSPYVLADTWEADLVASCRAIDASAVKGRLWTIVPRALRETWRDIQQGSSPHLQAPRSFWQSQLAALFAHLSGRHLAT
ncbi:unnamed protein product [Symbiodinium sp. CCMP2592]|nr:unnamed protein product [Symbiodinium sp. CCMP2592]